MNFNLNRRSHMKDEIRKAVAIDKALEDQIFEYFEKACNSFDLGEWQTAREQILRAWELLPNPKYNNACTDMVLSEMQNILTKTGDLARLETLFSEWIHDIETCGYKVYDAKPFILLAEIYLFKGDIDKAKEQFAKAKTHKASKRDFSEKPAFYNDIMNEKITDNAHIKQLFDDTMSAKNTPTQMLQISEENSEKINELCQEGNELFDRENYHQAIGVWQTALDLVPEPKQFYGESQWIEVAIGDAYFAMKQYADALTFFESAKGNIENNAYENPFICLRLGQCYLEQDDIKNAQEFLLRAYMFEGKEIFEEEDTKYFDFLQKNIPDIE